MTSALDVILPRLLFGSLMLFLAVRRSTDTGAESEGVPATA